MMNKTIFRTVVTLIMWLTCQSLLAASLTSSVDRILIGSGETLQLRVRFDQQTREEPDFSPLEYNFEIISRSQQNKFSMGGGATSSYTEWSLQLLPKKTGKLLIPSLRLRGEVSEAIEINVAKQANSNGASQAPIFIETIIDKDEVYVQAQLLFTLRISHSVSLDGISSEELIIDDANIVKVGESDFYKTINGIKHRVIELKFAVFPESSGTLTIPSIRLDATLPDRNSRYSGSFFNRGGKLVVLRSDKKTITVKPRPQNSGTGDWLPSQGISISEKWSRPLDELVAGEPVTRTITITSQGLAGAQLPPLNQPRGEGFKVYPDQPQLNDDVDNNGIIGNRSESMAFVPTREGSIPLPPVTLEWWDTVNNKLQTTVLASHTLEVKPNTELAQTTAQTATQPTALPLPALGNTSPESIPKNNLWLWLSLTFNLVLTTILIVTVLKWRQRSSNPMTEINPSTAGVNEKGKEKELFKAVKKSAVQGKADVFRENVLKWAQQYWQRGDLTTLQQLMAYSDDTSLRDDFSQLDQSLYGGTQNNTEIDLTSMASKLEKLRQSGAKKDTLGHQHGLKPLYENS